MGVVTSQLSGPELTGDQLVVHTPILNEGQRLEAHILVTSGMIERVTDLALEGIDGWDAEETKEDAIESWVGRFATGELDDAGIQVSGWSANMGTKVNDVDAISPGRILPFLVHDRAQGAYWPVTAEKSPELLIIEGSFATRALAFMLEKQIIS